MKVQAKKGFPFVISTYSGNQPDLAIYITSSILFNKTLKK
jgi:transposase